MSRRSGLRLIPNVVGAIFIFLVFMPAGVFAANISQSYHYTGIITNGSIVSLDPERSNYVQPANIDNGPRLLGIVDTNNSTSTDNTSGITQVATSGTVNTLVSTLNGNISVGDEIAPSPFNGIGIKALSGSHVIGLAETSLSNNSSGITTLQVKNKNGQTNDIQVGYVRVTIDVSLDTASGNQTGLNFLQQSVQSLTGRTVSTLRIILSMVVGFVALLALVVLIYTAVYSSIISIGRNPLARHVIFRSLGIVLIMALMTTIVAVTIIYFLLH